jgi:cell division protein FtsQ
MDGGGRFGRSLTALWQRRRMRRARAASPMVGPHHVLSEDDPVDDARLLDDADIETLRPHRARLTLRRYLARASHTRGPRMAGSAAVLALFAAAGLYGMVRGEHTPKVVDALIETRNAIGNAAGFRIEGVAIAGQKHVTEEDMLVAVGVTGNASLVFLDADGARDRLKGIPWIVDATVRKLYPDQLEIHVVEREAFALWQQDGKIDVISADGTVVGPVDPRFAHLPVVVGKGAGPKARAVLAMLDTQPAIRDQVRAAVLVSERRWNLRLKNGIDVRLPETDVPAALALLAQLDRSKKLLSRDIEAVDLRLPDRVTVRLSEAAHAAREEAIKARNAKPKGSGA